MSWRPRRRWSVWMFAAWLLAAHGGPAIAQPSRPPAADPLLAAVSRAASAGDLAAAQQALAHLRAAGRSLPAETPGRYTPLHLAILSDGTGALQVAELMLQNGVSIDARGPDGRTPLHDAVLQRRDDRALWLLERGARPDIPDAAGVTALERTVGRQASDSGMRAIVIEKLLAVETRPDRRNARGETLMHHAAWFQGAAVIEALIARGVPAAAADREGRTPLHALALRVGHAESSALPPHELARAVDLLLRAGAAIDARDNEGMTPTLGAATRSNESMLAILVARKADVRARAADGRTALMLANGEAVARWLLDHGADVTAVDARGRGALHYAARLGAPELTTRLLAAGLSPTAADREGLTALHLTAARDTHGAIAVAARLLDAGVAVDVRSACGLTPLHASAVEGTTAVAKLLVDRGADVNAKTTADCRWVPLIVDSPSPSQAVSIPAGSTPLDVAESEHSRTKWASGRHRQAIDLLKSRGGKRERGGVFRRLFFAR